MSADDVHQFLDRVTDDEALRDEIRAALAPGEDRAAQTVTFAGRLGYHFTDEELLRALEQRYGGRELTEAELEPVAGGMLATAQYGGLLSSFPDVCKIPSPGGPVPMPYPNLGTVTPSSSTPLKKSSP